MAGGQTGPGRRWAAAAGADLRGADLRGQDLTEADLRGADLTGHDGPVAAIAASADGSTIATASGDNEASSGDGTVRVWDAGTGQAVVTLAALPGGGHAAWFPDDSMGALWWAIKLCRFEPGELDPYLPALRRRGEATPSPPSA